MSDFLEYQDAVAQGLAPAPGGAEPIDCADCIEAQCLGFGACSRCRGEEWAPEREPAPPLHVHECLYCGEVAEAAEDADGLCASCADALQGAGAESAEGQRHKARAEALALAERTPEPPPDIARDVAEVRWNGAGDPWRAAASAVAGYEREEDAAGCRRRALALRLALADLHASLDSAPASMAHVAQRRLLRAMVGAALRGDGVRELWAACVVLRDY